MKAVAYQQAGAIERENALVDVELPEPRASGFDLLVEVRAVSVNPVDTKVRKSATPPPGEWKVLGWDAAGIVTATGPDVSRFKLGDAVFYAGAIGRPGSNSERQLVDERIVGRKPESVGWADAAALPLTAITAWEALFDRLDVRRPVAGASSAILIVGGAGGVGSIAVQLARTQTDLTVIATASRPETVEWVQTLGAHHVIDHTKPLAAQVAALGLQPGFVFSTTQTDRHLGEIGELISPQGRFAFIDDPDTIAVGAFKRKSVSIHLELMFTRSMFATADMDNQGDLLDQVSTLVDAGTLRSTVTERLSPINAVNLIRAHSMSESGRTRGKIVIEGWEGSGG